MDELKNTTPELSKLKKENPFRAPDNYFDDFSARLNIKLEAEKASPPKQKTSIIRLLKPALGLAASFAIIFMLVYVPLKTFIPEQQITETTASNEFQEDEFQTILEELDESSFFAMLGSDDTDTELSDEDLLAYVSTNLSSYEIFEYTEN